jgi:protein TonB
MFQETLLESSSKQGRRKRWPMATAFLLESAAATAIVAVPLLSTGVIPVSARVPIIAPLRSVEVVNRQTNLRPAGNIHGLQARAVRIVMLPSAKRLVFGPPQPDSNESPLLPLDDKNGPGHGERPGDLVGGGNALPPSPPPLKKPVRISELSEAMLLHKVEPVYPHIAKISGITGTVKLYAIIAKDGSIQSLSLISGHPILATAALAAVEKWRYRPYLLNGEAVEVETFITVNFRKAGQ